MSCQNNIRQLSVATFSFEAAKRQLPPGVHQENFAIAPVYRGSSLFVHLLAYMEETAIRRKWDFDDPIQNAMGGTHALTATVLPMLLCPSDVVESKLVQQGSRYYALASYGGNGGTHSYFPSAAKTNGLFHTTGPASEPVPNQRPVRMHEIRDGASNTFLFGERDHADPNLERFALLGWTPSLSEWGWWAVAGGRKAIGHVTMSSQAGINCRISFVPESAGEAEPPVHSGLTFAFHGDPRLSCFGSQHPGGAVFGMADGSQRFVSETIEILALRALSTRAGGESISSADASRRHLPAKCRHSYTNQSAIWRIRNAVP